MLPFNTRICPLFATLLALFLLAQAIPSWSTELLDGDRREKPEATPSEKAQDSGRERWQPEVSFPGQYRINAYSVDEGYDGSSRTTAARLRVRQSLDLRFDERFSTHLQLELGHTVDNVSTTDSLSVRHATMHYESANGAALTAGIAPLSDHYGDALFSADWNYNPLAVAFESPVGNGEVRLFAGNLHEGSENDLDDDLVHYQADYLLQASSSLRWKVAGSFVDLPSILGENTSYYLVSAGVDQARLGTSELSLSLAYSHAERGSFGLEDKASGWAVWLASSTELGPWGLDLRASWAEGREDGGGFWAPMALARTNGYWGLTGLLTVQGPTDTGFDGDAVNLSNNGYGLASVQARLRRSLSDRFEIQVAAGWFGASRAEGRASELGFDLLAMATWRLHPLLTLDAGLAGARLEDSVSGYHLGAAGGFASDPGTQRDKTALFLRLQTEF